MSNYLTVYQNNTPILKLPVYPNATYYQILEGLQNHLNKSIQIQIFLDGTPFQGKELGNFKEGKVFIIESDKLTIPVFVKNKLTYNLPVYIGTPYVDLKNYLQTNFSEYDSKIYLNDKEVTSGTIYFTPKAKIVLESTRKPTRKPVKRIEKTVKRTEPKLNKDVLMHMAMGMEYEDIINLCLTKKEYNRYLCENQYFWKNKLTQDYGFEVGKLKLSKYIYRFLNYVDKTRDNPDIWIDTTKNLIQNSFLYAAVKGDLIIIQELLKDKRVDPAAYYNLAIKKASEHGHWEVVKELLKDERVDPAAANNMPIRLASENGHWEVVKELLKDERVDPSADNNEAIRLASQNGHLEVVKELLKDPRVDPADWDNHAIRWASKNGHLEVVKILLKDKRVDPSAYDNYAIRWASLNGHWEVVKELLKDPRVNPAAGYNEPIISASLKGHLEVVKELLKDPRVNPSARNNMAIRFADNPEVVKELKKHGVKL